MIDKRRSLEKELREEDRLFDFLSVYDTVTGSMPSLDGFAKRYGFDFRDKKPYHERCVEKAKTPLEIIAVAGGVNMNRVYLFSKGKHSDNLINMEQTMQYTSLFKT